MERSSAEGRGGRIAVFGAASPTGAHVKVALANRGVPGARVELYGHRREVVVLSEYDGEARLVRSADELDPAACAAVIVCEPVIDAHGLVGASDSGTVIIDMTGSIPGAVLAGSPAAPSGRRLVAVPHALTTLLTALLAPIHGAIGLTGASVFVVRPASDFGEAGLEELREQTVHLLRFESTPTNVFGRQLAFNVLPEPLFPLGEEAASERVVRECRELLGAPELPLAMSATLVPTFFGHAVAAHLDLAGPGHQKAVAAWRATPGIEVAVDAGAGATLDAPESQRIQVTRVDAISASRLRIWAVGLDPGGQAAATAIAVAAEAGVV